MAGGRPVSDRIDDMTALDGALRDLAGAIDYPKPGVSFAAVVARRIAAGAAPRSAAWWRTRPVRRAVLVAIALALIVAAVAGAIGLGLPGLRILLAPPPSIAPTPS